MNGEIFSELYEQIAKTTCINSHSHLPQEWERLEEIPDALTFFTHSYPASDLSSAGMPETEIERLGDTNSPLERRWALLEPYWPYVRFTGYVRSILIAFRDLFGFQTLDRDTIAPLSEAIAEHSRRGYYSKILVDRCNILKSVAQMDDLVEVDRRLFVPMPRLNRFSMIENSSQVKAIEELYGVRIGSLDELVSAIDGACAGWKNSRVAGVKMSQSYFRRMDFHRREVSKAARVFDSILSGEEVPLMSERGKVLGDFLVFESCRAASERDLTIQFHLGLRAGTYNSLEGCSPAPMVELFRAYPDARFDLSHSGYPYLHESAVIAKGWSNVFLNMDWIQCVSPEGSRRALKEWLRMVPYNKIVAFGDDVAHVEVVYGALVIARRNVASVLGELIEEGELSESDAADIIQAVFVDVPTRLYLAASA